MKLADYKLVFIIVGLIGIPLVASPLLENFIHIKGAEPFSEIYLLGPDNMVENYPFNIISDKNYSIYVGVNNHLGTPSYYLLCLELRNQTDVESQPLYEYRFIIGDGEKWVRLLNFSLSGSLISSEISQIDEIIINDCKIKLCKPSTFDSDENMFYYQLRFKLYVYDIQSCAFIYDNRYVNLRLNFTQNS